MANKSMQQLLGDFNAARTRMENLNRRLPSIIGVEAVKVVKQNFQLQGYDDGNGVTPWAPRSAATNAAYDYNRNAKFRTATGRKSIARNRYKGSVVSSSNPILLQTRNLYSAITYFAALKSVIIGVDQNLLPYAEKMNEGGPGKWGHNPHTDTPARKYMPDPNEPPNRKILMAVEKKVTFEQDKILKDFKK